ncbi:MAG: hypothetical protein ACC628_07325 [Pirellulaceae bacterium]
MNTNTSIKLQISALLIVLCIGSRFGFGEEALLVFEDGAAEGLVAATVDLTAAAKRCQATPVDLSLIE